MFAYEKEIVLYAHFKKLDYFSTECVYSPNAYRGNARYGGISQVLICYVCREFIKQLEASNPQLISALLKSISQLELTDEFPRASAGTPVHYVSNISH